MEDKTKKYLFGIVAPSLILVSGYLGGQISVEKFRFGAIMLAGGLAGYYIYKNWKLGSWKKEWEEEAEATNISRSIGLEEAMESLKEWSQEHYVGDQQIHFRWDSTIYKTTVEKDPATGDEYMFYAFVTIGENNRYILVCLEGKNGEIVEYQPVLYEGMLKDPFDYVEMVRELRKNKFRTAKDDLDQFSQQSDWRSVYRSGGRPGAGARGGMPLDNSLQRPGAGAPQNQQELEIKQDNEGEGEVEE